MMASRTLDVRQQSSVKPGRPEANGASPATAPVHCLGRISKPQFRGGKLRWIMGVRRGRWGLEVQAAAVHTREPPRGERRTESEHWKSSNFQPSTDQRKCVRKPPRAGERSTQNEEGKSFLFPPVKLENFIIYG